MALLAPGAEIEIRGLSRVHRVGDEVVHALRAIDLDVAAGEFLGVVGVSGSGKSTLLHLIGGLDTPTAGSILVDRRSLGDLSSWERSLYRREVVGFVFQTFHLVRALDAESNVRVPLVFAGVNGREARRLARDALARVGLDARRHHRPGQLSGGERQRVALARAIVHSPRLLLADEPTANLDHATSETLLDLVESLRRERGMTVVLVTHDREIASRYCDRQVRLRDGALVPTEEEAK